MKTEEELTELNALVQWELESMTDSELQEFFIETLRDVYLQDDAVYQEMRSIYKEYLDNESILEDED